MTYVSNNHLNSTLLKSLFLTVMMSIAGVVSGQASTTSAVTPAPNAITEITGAGATFPYPIYAKWAAEYKKKTGIGLNYQSIGSGGGIKSIKDKTVDFGASDKPLGLLQADGTIKQDEDLEKLGLVQFPAIIGGVVLIVNLDGVTDGQITLDGPTISKIYLGTIKKWNDPAIVAMNKGVNLPELPIQVIHRSDGSGTTFLFTTYLANSDEEGWKKIAGAGSEVKWPTGVGGKGNEGVASLVQQTKGAIGYVEYAYTKKSNLVWTKLINKSGKAVSPNGEAFQAAAKNAKWDSVKDFALILTNQSGEKSWPITGASFILIRKDNAVERSAVILKFFEWAYANGKDSAKELDFVPLPDALTSTIKTTWQENLKDSSGHPIWEPAHN
ncbi:phosphate ABC transporter substrate-binding protein PstS [Candidatus Paracaedibacter symbiosus]|uniref:phosphate ABC transporter substrate-binding protein PstS n=1 Tax=Candidatus Paracaedibacter symbiosus TaxID=244582 RepID=UPI000B2F5759|nr:phosphate ABC transporter substrate-binding protein PstS [Candidatus Paracaedibacter symbiosus]